MLTHQKRFKELTEKEIKWVNTGKFRVKDLANGKRVVFDKLCKMNIDVNKIVNLPSWL